MGHATDQAPTPPSPRTEPWPDGVTVRYLTTAAEITGAAEIAVNVIEYDFDEAFAKCAGCDTVIWQGGSHRRARELAQGHAEKCRALPRPAVNA